MEITAGNNHWGFIWTSGLLRVKYYACDSREEGKSSESLSLSSNIELEIKFIAKNLGNVITLESFKIAGTGAFPLSKILFDNFHNS